MASGDTLFISDVVVAELVWVLSVSYRISREQIDATLRDLPRARHLTFAASDQLTRAVDLFARGKGDFADYLIGVHARVAGCETAATFDRVLLRESGFMTPMQAR